MKKMIKYMKLNTLNFEMVLLVIVFIFPVLTLNSEDYSAPIIQPGMPGSPSKILDADEATKISNTSYISADVEFLQGMIVHHEQAIVMSNMADERTNNKTIIDLAKRIDVSQEDEINFMESWLKQRNEYMNKMQDKHHMHMGMVGMATPKQLNDLRNSNSTDFDRLFLQLMITHHDGALEMVEELKKYPGNAYDPVPVSYTHLTLPTKA